MKTIPIKDLSKRAWAGFNKRIQKTESCWLWTGLTANKYGIYCFGYKKYRAHRIAYEKFLGKTIPEGMVIDHLCRNPICVNPEHMEVVTISENNRRSSSPSAVNARKKVCNRGHVLEGSNLYIKPSGLRQCRACRALKEAINRKEISRRALERYHRTKVLKRKK